jgi:hypothetical protein
MLNLFSFKWCFIFFLLCFSASQAKQTTSITDGNWNSFATWSNGVPACGDTIIVDSATTVTVSSSVGLEESDGCSIPIHLKIAGTLHFNTGRKMYLSCNSFLEIPTGGKLEKGSGGGNSNVIDICATTVWNAGSGSKSGPITYGSGTPLPITLLSFDACLIGKNCNTPQILDQRFS